MSYEYDDMLAGSDRGYEMNLDSIVSQKKEVKKVFDVDKILEEEKEDLINDAIAFGFEIEEK